MDLSVFGNLIAYVCPTFSLLLQVLDLMEEVSEEDNLDENRNKVGPPSSEIGWGVGASPHVNQVSANSAGDRVTSTGADTLTVEGGGDVCYYSDTEDSTIMMSGNSPFISKAARCNFLSRSGKTRFSLIKISMICFSKSRRVWKSFNNRPKL